jgi:hypothetical protein
MSDVLDDWGIEHGSLSEGPSQFNLNASDSATVFCKVQRAANPASNMDIELLGIDMATRAGLRVPQPMLSSPVDVTLSTTRKMTVWSHLTLGSDTLGPEHIDTILTGALSMAGHTSEHLPAFDFVGHAAGLQQRLASVVHPLKDRIKDIGSKHAHTVLTRLDPNKCRWVHGDLHLGNVAMSPDGLTFLDWETTCVGPPEWDASQLMKDLLALGTTESVAAATKVRSAYCDRFDIDEVLLDSFVSYRIASYMSFLLTGWTDEAQFAKMTRLLNDHA